MGTRAKLLLVGVVAAAVALGVGLALALTSDDSKTTLSHAEFARLFAEATVGKTRVDVLDEWPKPPYQDFHDGSGNRCLEWLDKGEAGGSLLYDLCFDEQGVLVSKQSP